MSKSKDEVLDQAIGEMGAVETPHSLGKIQHQEILGKKAELSTDEKTSMEGFLARSRKQSEEAHQPTSVADGWIPIDREELGARSQFYPSDWVFHIRPATVQAIKNWTSIDEERPDVMNRVFNDIIKSCVKIETSSEPAGWAKINSWDRFWFIAKIREYTFTGKDQNIEFEDDCSECGAEVMYKLKASALHFDMPDEDIVENYWVGDHWEIDPKEYGVDASPIKLYNPTLQKDQAIIDWAVARSRNGQQPDETFIRFLPWLVKSAPRDINVFDGQVSKIYKEYKNWKMDYFELMDDIVANIIVTPSETLKTTCPHCGQEAVSRVRFPNGIKALFKVETGARRFGSKRA